MNPDHIRHTVPSAAAAGGGARILAAILVALGAAAVTPAADFPSRLFTARWVTVPGVPQFEYGVRHFRRAFELHARPSRFVILVTADNRYQLFVNGVRVAWGPARGDVFRWHYETLDIAAHLKPGRPKSQNTGVAESAHTGRLELE